jgi:hypothetical protein
MWQIGLSLGTTRYPRGPSGDVAKASRERDSIALRTAARRAADLPNRLRKCLGSSADSIGSGGFRCAVLSCLSS